jgi:short subunit dehydrogenase-like uncharacterized protein
VVAGSPEEVLARLRAARPSVVVNTVGPFVRSAVPVLRACPPGTHYVDLSNELPATRAVLELHDELAGAGSCAVTGAGFGVLGTESATLALCAGRPAPVRLRVDAVPSVRSGGELLGEALAGSLVEALVAGGRVYAGGRLARARFGTAVEGVTLPDGTAVRTAAVPFAELEAAYRASGAPSVVSASSEVPGGRAAARVALPVLAAVLAVPSLRRAAKRCLARVRVPEGGPAREHSWARAHGTWADGSTREVWLRADAMAFTTAVATEITLRLARAEGTPGAYTPGALFGPSLARAAGGVLSSDASDASDGDLAAQPG